MNLDKLYIGTYTSESSKGIYKLDKQKLKLAAELDNPSYIIFNKKKTRAYAVSETQSFNGRYGGGAAVFDVIQNGCLSLQSFVPTYGTDPCHLCLSQKEDALFIANYSDGSLCRWELDKNGYFTDRFEVKRHTGCGPHQERQTGPHIHFVALCPWNQQLLWVVDLGTDSICIYHTDYNGLNKPLHQFLMPGGYGPRHIAFHPILPLAYVIQELANRVVTIQISSSGFPEKIISDCSTLPSHWNGQNTAAAIRCNRSGTCLYTSNRGHDSVIFFPLDSQGIPGPCSFHKTGGKDPRDIALTPDENYLLCAHQNGGGITCLPLEKNGVPGAPTSYLDCTASVCLAIP